MKLRATALPLILVVLSLTAQFGCDSSGPAGNKSFYDYYIIGTVIQDPNIDSSIVISKLLRDTDDYGGANLTFGTDNLVFYDMIFGFDSVYYFSRNNSPGYSAGVKNLAVDDSPDFTGAVNVTVPGNFVITNFIPPNHIKNGNENVSIEWSGSANAQGYVIATVLEDSAYTEYGYSEWVDVSFNAKTFPNEAFSQSPGPNIDTGLYNVYVYAITGIPDSALTSQFLPVPLPLQFPDNISGAILRGRFGSIQVIFRDTVRVQTIP